MKYRKTIGIIFEKTLGDLIYTSSIVASIRKNEPDAFIHVVTSESGLVVLQSDKPDYDLISTKFNPIYNYDVIFQPLKCAQYTPNWIQYGMHIRDLAAQCIGIDLSVKTSNIVQPKEPNTKGDYIIINNHASCDKLKEVPANVINEVANLISKDYTIIHIGLANEAPISNTTNLLGSTTLLEALQLIKNAKMTIGIDNYISHATAAYNRPLLGIYGQYHYEQVKPVDNTECEIINKGILGQFNTEGVTKVTVEEIYNSYLKLKEK